MKSKVWNRPAPAAPASAALLAALVLIPAPASARTALAAFTQVQAQVQSGANALRDRLFGLRAGREPIVGRYVAAQGTIAFVLDRSGPRPLLRFEDSDEVWVLTPVAGPRGDILYRNDVGQTMLRGARMGGMTVYSPRSPSGAAVSLTGRAGAIQLQQPNNLELIAHLAALGAAAGRRLRHALYFESPGGSAVGRPVAADAATIATETVVRLNAPVFRIRLIEGDRPEATVNGSGLLVVTFTARDSFAGRPSSAKIARALAER